MMKTNDKYDESYCFTVGWKRNVGCKEVTKNTSCKQSAVSNTGAEDDYVKVFGFLYELTESNSNGKTECRVCK